VAWWLRRTRPRRQRFGAGAALLAIAVYSAARRDRRPDIAWLGAALAEQLSEGLRRATRPARGGERTRQLGAGRPSPGASGWSEPELRRVAELYGANRVVRGVVRGAGDRLLVELRLADERGRELDPGARIQANATPGELATLAGTLTAELARRLHLARPAAPRGATVAPAAYAAFAEGVRASRGRLRGRRGAAQDAVRADAAFAAAWLRLAGAVSAGRGRSRAKRGARRGVCTRRSAALEIGIVAALSGEPGGPELAQSRRALPQRRPRGRSGETAGDAGEPSRPSAGWREQSSRPAASARLVRARQAGDRSNNAAWRSTTIWCERW
jgi:hypothetical protein